jgi:arginyl-tRNA synthetase
LNFDLALAQEQSSKNPVYYVQYAHARICSILRKAESFKVRSFRCDSVKQSRSSQYQTLNETTELDLIRQLIKFPEIVEDTARDYQVQRLPYYTMAVANNFHKFYENCRVLEEDKEIAQARINLVKATKIVLKNTLELIGISAPEKM